MRAAAVVPPIVFDAESYRLTPSLALPRSSVPPASRPMRLPRIVLLETPLSSTPLPPLPEMTLPSSASLLPSRLVPIVMFVEPLVSATPSRVLPRTTAPLASRPMMLPAIQTLLESKTSMPCAALAEMMLRASALLPPMVVPLAPS